jgi:hypothetical protein
METDAFPMLRTSVSSDRLEPYLAACGGDQAAAARLYAWNIQVSAAFQAPLGCLEIVCRNAMHRQLSALFGCENWWDAPELRLHHTAQRIVGDARRDILRRRGAITSGRMVSELPFGFWVSLLGSGIDYETRLWRPALHNAFPGYRGRRAMLHLELDACRLLRNRIAHYGPIYKRDLDADHARILRLLGYLSWDYAAWVQAHERIPSVLAIREDIGREASAAGFLGAARRRWVMRRGQSTSFVPHLWSRA